MQNKTYVNIFWFRKLILKERHCISQFRESRTIFFNIPRTTPPN